MSRVIRAEMQYGGVAFIANLGGMKPAEIRTRLNETGRTQMALARAVGKSKDSISRLLKGERSLDVDEAEQIQRFFGDDQPRAPVFIQLPVYGYVAPGALDRVSIEPDQVLDRLEIPSGLLRGEGIVVRVPGDTMEPRLYSGETVIAGRNVPPQRLGDCVVELKDGTAMVKQYRGQRDNVVFLHQHNPDQEIRIDATKVKGVHAVLYRR